MTWVGDNTDREREEAERSEESEDESVQRARRGSQANPIFDENEHSREIHEAQRHKHRHDWDRRETFQLHLGESRSELAWINLRF